MPHVVSTARDLVVGLALLPIVLPPVCAAPGPEATVVSVGDGDTIRVRMNGQLITVRLAASMIRRWPRAAMARTQGGISSSGCR